MARNYLRKKKNQRKEYTFVKACLNTTTTKLLIVKEHEWKQKQAHWYPHRTSTGALCEDDYARTVLLVDFHLDMLVAWDLDLTHNNLSTFCWCWLSCHGCIEKLNAPKMKVHEVCNAKLQKLAALRKLLSVRDFSLVKWSHPGFFFQDDICSE